MNPPAPVSGEKAAALFGQLLQPQALKEVLERQIFAERNEMNFVVQGRDRAVGIDDVNRIIGRGIGGIDRFGEPHRAGNQNSAVMQKLRDFGKRVGLARQKKRKRRFRPDQMRCIVHSVRLSACDAIRQSNVTVDD